MIRGNAARLGGDCGARSTQIIVGMAEVDKTRRRWWDGKEKAIFRAGTPGAARTEAALLSE